MRLAWATDLHLDSVDLADVEAFCDSIKADNVAALVLSGDIAEARNVVEWLELLHSRLRLPIHFVLGNHDFYGSDIATVRGLVSSLDNPHISYLPSTGPVQLTPEVALVGHDGWGDCRIGDLKNFELLRDCFEIRDLSETMDLGTLRAGNLKRGRLRRKLQALGQDSAEALAPHVHQAARNSESVLVVTHVPPFREACWHDGSISAPTWLPGFTCKAVGDMLIRVSEEAATKHFTTLCGHTHGFGHVRMRRNLDVHTGFGDYGGLYVGSVDIDGTHVAVQAPGPA
jgi:3',5'-cyclic AMP phosphodiesterase CpdA